MSSTLPLSKTALTDQVTALVQERILDRVYQPGERLNIDALCREFGVSSSPIREALTRLVGEVLTVSISFAGFSVAPMPTRAWFEQLRDYRILTEGWAARRLARARTPSALARMAGSVQEMTGASIGHVARDYLSVSRADEAFHDAILDACGNEILARGVRNLRPHLQHARLFSQTSQDIEPLIEEHRTVLAAIAAGDEEGAAQAMQCHLRASWQRYDSWSGEDEPASPQRLRGGGHP